jgi:hypothetical protein
MSSSQQEVCTAALGEQGWNFEAPPAQLKSAKMQLLTIGGVAVIGHWYGVFGQYFVGWAPLLKVPQDMKKHVKAYNGPRDGK